MPSMLDIAKGIKGKSAERLTRQAAGVVDSRSKTRYGTVVSYNSTKRTIVAALDGGGARVTLSTDTAADPGDRITAISEGGVWKVLNVRHVQAMAQAAQTTADEASSAASAASSAAAGAASAAATVAQDLASNVQTINNSISAINQYFWHDDNGCHVATAANNATAQTNSLWNSLGIYFRRGVNNLVTLLDSGLTFFDGGGNTAGHITAQFSSDHIYLGKNSSSSVIDMCNSVFQLLVTAGQGVLQSTSGIVLRLYGDSDDGVGVGPTGEAIVVSGTGVRISSGATTSITSTRSITINSTGGITYINGSSVRTTSDFRHIGGGIYMDSTNLTDKTVVSSQTNSNANLFYRDSGGAQLGFFGMTFQPDGRQGVRFYTSRTPEGGSATTNGCALYVDSTGKRVTTFNSAQPWRYALRVAQMTITRTAGQALSAATDTKVVLQSALTTDATMLTNSSNGIKCLLAGTVMVSACLYATAIAGAGGLSLRILKNSTEVIEIISPADTSTSMALTTLTPFMVSVSANDVIYLYARSTTAATLKGGSCYLTVEYCS